MLKIPGLGGKKIAKLYKELQIDSIDALKLACEEVKSKDLLDLQQNRRKNFTRDRNLQSKPERTAVWQIEPIVEIDRT